MARGGTRAGAGRPKGAQNTVKRSEETLRTARIVLSCTEDEKRKLQEQAQAHGKNITQYILDELIR